MAVSERVILIAIAAIVFVSALFCVVGLGTKGWYAGGIGLFDGPFTAPKALSIISLLLLIFCIIAFVLQILGILRDRLRLVPVVLLAITTIFLLATFTSSVTDFFDYSFDLMVVAHFFSYMALAMAVFSLALPRESNTGS